MPNLLDPLQTYTMLVIYAFDLAVVGENSTIPANVEIGKNTAIRGETTEEDFPQGKLESGGYIIKEGEES